MQDEEWRPIPGFPDYKVSSLGRIVSYKKPAKPRELVGGTNGKGYRMVRLHDGGGSRNISWHSLVAAAFLGPRPAGLDVLHGDGNRMNNAASNLRYGTRSVNEYDKVRHGTHHQTRKTHCPSGHPYDDENTYVLPSRPTARYCRACARNRSRARASTSSAVAC